MAYAVLGSLTQTIDQILNYVEALISEYGKQQIELLLEQVIFLREFLVKFPREAIKLETRIRNAANQAEDVMEHFMYEHIRSHHKSTRSISAVTDDLYDFREFQMAMEEIESIAEEAAEMKTKATNRGVRPTTPSSSLSTMPSPTVDVATVGMEEDLKKIVESVCGASPDRVIIPITGMGGIGKTTLAKKVYDDPLVMSKFRVRAWITVSQVHKPENIFADLLYSLEKIVEEGLLQSSDSTEDKLYKILTVKKYLIVLDDVWSETAWDDIRRAFGDPRSGNGSRIVMTTRIASVATYVSRSGHHEMQLLNPDQSWDLMVQKVFPPGMQCPPSIEKTGREIATGLGGLPLAIVLIAGILTHVGETPDSWVRVGKEVTGKFEKIISLSYTHLPLYLRPCFLYAGSFEDHDVRISKLIKLWIAEGFVKHEQEAEQYLSSLMMRNLVTVTAIKSDGKVKSCSIHDMVRDLCNAKTLDDNYERRLSISNPDLTRLAEAYALTLRSVISIQPKARSLSSLRKFRLLRVLDVVDTDAYSLPAPVFDLFHLRYLAFGCPMEVPSAISRLQNLRALIIRPSKRSRRYSTDELYLPLEIWMMPLLTHLVSFYDILPNPEQAASALHHLVTLSVVKKLICTEEMMKMICNVKKLAISYSVDKYQQDYQLHNLVLLHQLEKLTLVMTKGSLPHQQVNPIFPHALRKLTLSGWRFPWEDMEAVACLPNLQVLKLRDHACVGDTWETDEEQFPKLEFLLIDTCDLENWVTEKAHFPILKRLVLYGCSELSEIPDDIGEITTLELIEVDHANESLVECVQRIVEEQRDEYDNKLLQVRAL